MATMKECEAAWRRFDRLKDEAEQHSFTEILMWDLKLAPLFDDLCRNWNEHHAEVFLRGMKIMFASFGIDLPKIAERHDADTEETERGEDEN